VIYLCAKHKVPVVIVCGRNKVQEEQVPVFDLVSMFSVEQCMKETRDCLKKLLNANVKNFPILKDL
jgi:glycerate kinase